MSTNPRGTVRTGVRAASPSGQALLLLRTLFIVAPILFGLDKFANVLLTGRATSRPSSTTSFPAPRNRRCTPSGVVEVLAGVAVAVVP